jgi:hypothetical protein
MHQSQSAACDARGLVERYMQLCRKYFAGNSLQHCQEDKVGSSDRPLGRQADRSAAIIGRWRLWRCSILDLSCTGTKGSANE